jgi:hypothetical protein
VRGGLGKGVGRARRGQYSPSGRSSHASKDVVYERERVRWIGLSARGPRAREDRLLCLAGEKITLLMTLIRYVYAALIFVNLQTIHFTCRKNIGQKRGSVLFPFLSHYCTDLSMMHCVSRRFHVSVVINI